MFPVHVAASRALLCSQSRSLTTNTLHSELVFNLSGSRNVTDSLRKFGISNGATQLLVCAFDADAAKLQEMLDIIDGCLADLDMIEAQSHLSPEQVAIVKKHYKIQDVELRVSTLADAIVTRIATKSVCK